MRDEGFRVTLDHEADHWWFRSRRDLIMRQVGRAARSAGYPRRKLRILDFGCGTGHNLPFFSVFGEVLGADRLRHENYPTSRNSEFRILDADRDLSALTASFDIVTALDVLEHLDDDVEGLRRIGGLLADGGRVVLTVPAYRWLWSGEDVISEHRRRYTQNQLLRVCESAGFRVEYSSYFNLSILPGMALVVWARRLSAGGTGTTSNLSRMPKWINRALYEITAKEAAWVGGEWGTMPAGASIVCRLLKL